MNLLTQLLALSFFILLLAQAVDFHRATVCRQKAWEHSMVVFSRSLFPKASEKERSLVPSCQILVKRESGLVSWRKLKGLQARRFEVEVKGKL